MKYKIIKPDERGKKQIDWLESNFSFSFSNYQDPTNMGFGQLRAFNDDWLQPGKGFGTHPHDNMEIISIMLRGRMNHQDSMGYKNEVGPYDVQIMSAGSGLHHSEYNISPDGAVVNFLQIWIHPKLRNTPPAYRAMSFPLEDRRNSLKKIIGSDKSPDYLPINQDAQLFLGHLASGEVAEYHLKPLNRAVFIFVIEGSLTVNNLQVDKRHSIGLWQAADLQIQAGQESEFILIEVPIVQ